MSIYHKIKSALLSAKLKLDDRFSSSDYWKTRYNMGEHSGNGSYGDLAEFKASILNKFVKKHNIESIIEIGCGDGNQLLLADYPKYLGLDISPQAISICENLFKDDPSKAFKLVSDSANDKAELSLSLDVIYHLIENDVFDDYMRRLFDSSSKFVIVFSSNTETQRLIQAPHVRHREFTQWVTENRPNWELIKHIKNQFPYNAKTQSGSFADFFIFENRS